MTKSKGTILELIATLFWASSFVVTKGTTDGFPPILLVGLRFVLGSFVVAFFARKCFKETSKDLIIKIFIISVFYSAGVALQTIGIKYTSPGRSAFITAAYCIFVPIIELILFKKKPQLLTVLSAIVCLLGVGLIVLDNGLDVDFGDLYTLAGSICMAVEIGTFGRIAEKYDNRLASFYLLLFSGLVACVVSPFIEEIPTSISTNTILAILYLAIACSGVAMMFLGLAQTVLPASTVSIILGFEAVFAAIISAIVYKETFAFRCIIGCLLVFLSTFVVLFDFKPKKDKKS